MSTFPPEPEPGLEPAPHEHPPHVSIVLTGMILASLALLADLIVRSRA